MTHARQTIREKIVTNVTGLGLTGSNVFDTKLYNLTQASLPALCVYAEAESSEMSNITSNTLDRSLDVMVEAYCEQNDQIEDTLDTICEQIEEAIGADPTLTSSCASIVLTNTEIDFTSLGEKPVGIARLSYTVNYLTKFTDSSNPL
tara:strand:+ start:8573 stop:9013 length:441 start_codon:yes stop_codon:yes gene_type:complete